MTDGRREKSDVAAEGDLTADGVDVSFLGRPGPPGVQVRTIVLRPGETLDVRRADWVDTLVVVELGELAVECHDGTRARFGGGAVLVLDTPEPRRLRGATDTPLVLSALSRRRAASPPDGASPRPPKGR